MVAEAIQEVAQASKNWAETEEDHAARLEEFYNRLPSRLRWSNSVPLAQLHDYRHGLEANNRFNLAHKTRLSAVPKTITKNGRWHFDASNAAHKMAVMIVDGIFQPLTFGQWLRCIRFNKIADNNNAADLTIKNWKCVELPQYTLLRSDGGAKTASGKVSGKAADWGPECSRLLLNPRFEAKQIHPDCKEVAVSLYDGERLIATRPEHAGGTYQFNPRMTTAEWGGLTFCACPSQVLGKHLVSRKQDLPQDLPFCTFDADALKKAFPVVEKAVSRDTTRPILTYLLLQQRTWGLQVVSTDTYRLVLAEVPANATTDGTEIMVLPSALAAALESFSGEVVMAWGRGQVWFSDDYETGIAIPKEDGQFVNYRKVVPASCDHSATFDAKELAAAAKDVLTVAREDANRVVFTAEGGTCTLSASVVDPSWWNEDTEKCEKKTTHAKAAIPCEGDFQIAFNGRYILDFIGKMKGEVQFECNGPLNPAMFRQGEMTCVLMPMQIM